MSYAFFISLNISTSQQKIQDILLLEYEYLMICVCAVINLIYCSRVRSFRPHIMRTYQFQDKMKVI